MKGNVYKDAALMAKALLGRLDEAEREELERLLDDPAMRREWEELASPSGLRRSLEECGAYDWRKAYAAFRRERRTKRFFRPLYLKVAGAAAGLLLVAAGAWWSLRREERPAPAALAARSETAFRHDKAVTLTLADGRTMEVAKTDTVVVTGEGTRVNVVDGNLAYDNTDGAADTVAYNELSVPLGGECVIDLDDGTKVWMNSGSRLRFPERFGGGPREVFLEGEAYFDVEREGRPFVVSFPTGRVQVLGTEFAVRSYAGDSSHYATLAEGLVRVYTSAGDSLEVKPGEQAVIAPGTFAKREVRLDEYVGWKEGLFVFRKRRLGDIATQLERWYDARILFASKELEDLLFTGYLRRYDDIEVFFDALKRTGQLDYRIEGNCVLVFDN